MGLTPRLQPAKRSGTAGFKADAATAEKPCMASFYEQPPRAWGVNPTAAALQPAGGNALRPHSPAGASTPDAPPNTTPAPVTVPLSAASPDLDALSQVVLQLHRGSRDWPSASFTARACELVGALIPYSACLWGSARADLPVGTRLDMQGLYSEGLQGEALALCLAGLGHPPALQAAQQEPLASRRVELRLWRSITQNPASEGERSALNFLMPHLVEAQRENRLSRAYDTEASAPARRSHVLCDADGVLQQVDEHGLALLRSEWPRWAAARLPEPLARAVALHAAAIAQSGTATEATVPFHGRQVTVLITRSGDALLLEVRRRSTVDRLSPRQRDIATLYASGQTGPQIATQLKLSPSTVNNHLGVIFKKLSVSNKVQLLNAMRAR